MYDMYLLTGATGFLGSAVLQRLRRPASRIRVLVLPDDPAAALLPDDVEVYRGSVADKSSLGGFFGGDLRRACVIHCAGIVTIATARDRRLHDVNVTGTDNVLSMCGERGIDKAVYVSSVHAIPEQPKGTVIRESDCFSADEVVGQYAKSKAEATALALQYAASGLNVSVVHPSGIIGPNDRAVGSITGAMIRYCRGRLPFSVAGGYDFVDVRDVADGVISCAERGGRGRCYILSNRYATVHGILSALRELTGGRRILFRLPHAVVRAAARTCERVSLARREPLFLTPYSAYTLRSNALFSHERATAELGYSPRDLKTTLRDVVSWLEASGMIPVRTSARRSNAY